MGRFRTIASSASRKKVLGGYNLFSLVGVTKVCLGMSYLSPRGRRIRDYPDILSKFHDVVHANEYSQTTNPQVHNITVTNDFIKLWPGDRCKFAKPELAHGLAVGGQFTQVAEYEKTDDLWSTCVDLRWVAKINGEKLASTCGVRIILSSTQNFLKVGSHTKHKSDASRTPASPIGQGLSCLSITRNTTSTGPCTREPKLFGICNSKPSQFTYIAKPSCDIRECMGNCGNALKMQKNFIK